MVVGSNVEEIKKPLKTDSPSGSSSRLSAMSDRKAELERKKERLKVIREEKEKRKRLKEKQDADASAAAAVSGAATSQDVRSQLDKNLEDLGIAPVSSVIHSLESMGSSAVSECSDSLLPGSGEDGKKSLSTQTHDSGADVLPTRRIVGGAFDYYTLTYEEEYEEDSLPGLGSPSSGSPSNYLNKLPPEEEEDEAMKKKLESRRRKELSEEEKQVIMMKEDFQKFFDRTTRLVERALCEDVNVFVDYTGNYENDGEGMEDKGGNKLSLNRYFYDERWSKNRVITCMDWSTVHPELLLSSYNQNPESPHEPDGICLVWNTKFKKDTPEYIFHCQSAVMSCCFARFHPNLILGGTYSGQIVLWDNRVQKRTPVQRSPLSALAHTHPVYCMKVVGTQNAHNLISISTDGKLCSWSLDMLADPQETLNLQHKQTKSITATCLSFPVGDVNNFVFGTEEGTVYTACRHGSRAGVLDAFEGHQAPVTGINTHNGQAGPIDFSHLFLTSSLIGLLKLWSLKENKPLYSFEDNGDYVYDTAWSPIHPAMFATVDGTGRLDIWNLNNDTEVSEASVIVDGSPALNRVSWTQSGLHVTVGDDTGKIWVYDVGEQLAHPGPDEWNKFAHTLQDIKNNTSEEHDFDKFGGDLSGRVMFLLSFYCINSTFWKNN
ncbi:DYNC1I [Lepeophtheirus salmonis]|uniref:DYNC1I n=1 Tax=Lepeophtheirus salmonis TaxID=72036 RepID=A0A7R8CV91_LEPSM|nr:DYNC1I [Lepeophtheirus salmonis]CAF2941420.1 DYNC1I [Lepeophtheirus salmonis]